MRAATASVMIGLAMATVAAQGPGGPGAGPMREARKVVAQFDKDGDTRLNASERAAARAWLAEQPQTGPFATLRRMGQGGPGGGMGRGYAPSSAGKRVAPGDVKPAGAAPLYDASTLRTIFIQFPQEDWADELEVFWKTDVEVPATVTVDGKTFRDVGVHYRGMSSFMMVPAGSKRSLNLSFDFVHDGQALLGYRTVNLLNANGDATLVRPLLYYDIARHYLPLARVNYARVVINGEYWGVYVNAQQINADFTKEAFGKAGGARWKVPGSPMGRAGMEYLGEDVDAYRTLYEIKSKDDPQAWAALIRLFRTLKETPDGQLEAALKPMLDVDQVLRLLAVEMALVNTDGYWARASDYAIYMEPDGRFHVIPSDVNEAMVDEGLPAWRPGARRPPGNLPPAPGGPGAGWVAPQGSPPGMPPGLPPMPLGAMAAAKPDLDPLYGLTDATKPLRSRLLAVPALRARYLRYVREIAEKHMDWQKVEAAVRRYQSLIAADVEADTRKLYSYDRFQQDVTGGEHGLKPFIDARRAFLLKTLPM